jgi:hypothetical protein
MATPKSWTAHDITQGRFAVLQEDTLFHVERRYMFIDDVGMILGNVGVGRLTVDIEWSAIPLEVQNALMTIDNWTYNQILAQEGMT